MPKPGLKRYDGYPDFDASVFAYGLKAIRYDGYKLIRGTHAVHELYNLEKDPAERYNLFDEERDRSKELSEMLTEWESRSGTAQVPAYSLHDDMDVDEAVKSRLRDLGY